MEIVIDESKYGLKGPHNLALGNPPTSGGALGLGKEHENRPRDNVHKWENHNSDEMDDHFSEKWFLTIRFADFITWIYASLQFVSSIPSEGNYLLCSSYLLGRFSSVSYTQGGVSVRSFRNSALGYDILAFQAGRNTVINLCIESSFQKSSGRNDKRA